MLILGSVTIWWCGFAGLGVVEEVCQVGSGFKTDPSCLEASILLAAFR